MHPRAQYVAGIVCIVFVAVVWTLAVALKQIIFQDLKFDEPLILTYVCNVCYMVHLPLFAFGLKLGFIQKMPWRHPRQAGESDETVSTVAEAVWIGVIIAPVWFAAQWTYSAGVASTSATSSTVISTTSVVWTVLASVLFLRERLTSSKVAGVIACVAGNIATLWGSDVHQGQKAHLSGDIFCVIAAMLYATYTTILKRFAGPNISVMWLFGTIGTAICIGGAPILFWFSWGPLQRMTLKIFGLLIFNGIFDNVLSQFAWAKAVQWTSATTATVGLSLTIPLSIAVDFARGVKVLGWSFVAAGLVVLGFILVSLAPGSSEPLPLESRQQQARSNSEVNPLDTPLAHSLTDGEALGTATVCGASRLKMHKDILET